MDVGLLSSNIGWDTQGHRVPSDAEGAVPGMDHPGLTGTFRRGLGGTGGARPTPSRTPPEAPTTSRRRGPWTTPSDSPPSEGLVSTSHPDPRSPLRPPHPVWMETSPRRPVRPGHATTTGRPCGGDQVRAEGGTPTPTSVCDLLVVLRVLSPTTGCSRGEDVHSPGPARGSGRRRPPSVSV